MAKRDNTRDGHDAVAKRCEEMQSEKTTITLSITEEDKMKVKVYATTHKTTVSDLLHEWIRKNCKD